MNPIRMLALTVVFVACTVAVGSRPVTAADVALVNINTASATELAATKGIGDAKAKAIVEYREKNGPFKSVDDLGQVKGIGEQVLAKLRPQVTVGEVAGAPAPRAAAPGAAKR
jgi:competence protein ComEA